MRHITNKANLPQALVRALENDRYSKGDADYSTTELANPPRIVALKVAHKDEIEEDAAGLIYSLIGKLGHAILEEAGTADMIEKRLFWTMPDGTRISGCLDIVDRTVIEDWKFTSIYTSKTGVKFEWITQASVNRYLCEKNGIPITKARYIAIYRDWSAPKVMREHDYPRHQVEVFDVKMWSIVETERWIMERISLFKSALKSLPQCSGEDRWARSPGVAVMKKGVRKAVHVLPDSQSAQEYISKHKDAAKLYTEERKGDSMRCRFYCSVMPFCEQARSLGITPVSTVASDDSPPF